MAESQQNSTEYKPTQKEERLIEVLLDPANRMKSITDICGMVPCDRGTYYNAFDKPGFIELYTRKSQELAKKHLGQVMSAFVREAVRGSFQHGKVLLEMAGAYKETTRKEITGKDGDPVESNVNVTTRTSGLSKEEVAALAAEMRRVQEEDTMDDLGQFREEVTE